MKGGDEGRKWLLGSFFIFMFSFVLFVRFSVKVRFRMSLAQIMGHLFICVYVKWVPKNHLSS